MSWLMRKLIVVRLRNANKFIQRELDLIRINHPDVSMGMMLRIRYEVLRDFKNEILSKDNGGEIWE